jgi:hypothetical protein
MPHPMLKYIQGQRLTKRQMMRLYRKHKEEIDEYDKKKAEEE